jgi:hypothetical protein
MYGTYTYHNFHNTKDSFGMVTKMMGGAQKGIVNSKKIKTKKPRWKPTTELQKQKVKDQKKRHYQKNKAKIAAQYEQTKADKMAKLPPPPTEAEKQARRKALKAERNKKFQKDNQEAKREANKKNYQKRKAKEAANPPRKILKEATTIMTLHGVQHFGETCADFDKDDLFMGFPPCLKQDAGLPPKELRKRYQKAFPKTKGKYRTIPVTGGFLYHNFTQDLHDNKVHVINHRSKNLLRLIVRNSDGTGTTEVLVGNVPLQHKDLLDNAVEVSQQAYQLEGGHCRDNVGDKGHMKSIGAKYLHKYKENDHFGMYQLSKQHPDLRKKVAATLLSYYDFLHGYVKRNILEEIIHGRNKKGVSNTMCAEAIKKKSAGRQNVTAVLDFIKLMKEKHLYQLITSKNLNNTVHLGKFSVWTELVVHSSLKFLTKKDIIISPIQDKNDTSVSCSTWVFDRANKQGEDSIVAHFFLPNTYIDGKPVAIKLHHGTFIIWDGRKIWHNTVISKLAKDNNVYGLYTAANKGLGMP